MVNPFEYLSVLFSIIIGLALTDVLQAIRRLIVARRRLTPFWPSLLRVGVLTIVIVQVWWSVFGLSRVTDWTFGKYAIVLTHIALLYLATTLALPDTPDDEPVDLRAAYFADATTVYGLLVAATLASIAKDLVFDGRLPTPANLCFHVAFAACGTVAMFSRRDRTHLLITGGLLVGFIAYVAMLFDRLAG